VDTHYQESKPVVEGAFGKNDLFSQFSFQPSFSKPEACQPAAFCLADTRCQAPDPKSRPFMYLVFGVCQYFFFASSGNLSLFKRAITTNCSYAGCCAMFVCLTHSTRASTRGSLFH